MTNTRGKSTTTTTRPARSARSASPVLPVGDITGGVDTHKEFHVAAAKDSLGRDLGTKRFPTTHTGYGQLLTWLTGFGPVTAVGVEGTGAYGAGLTTHLRQQDLTVVEVNRPNRQKRRRTGKSDPKDAIAAAAAVQSGDATAAPKPRTGPVESVRVLRQTREHLTTARTATLNVLHALVITAPTALRESLDAMSTTILIRHCAGFAPPAVPVKGMRGTARTHTLDQLLDSLLDAEAAVRVALGELARTIQFYDTHITELDTSLTTLVTHIAPRTSALHGVGPGRAAQLLLTAGNHPDRIHSEPSFANLTGVAPQDCSSGNNQHHHRLSRAGDRHANSILYYIVLTRLATHQPTRNYMTTRLHPGTKMTKKHLIRCLKRYVAREIYPHLINDLTHLTNPNTPPPPLDTP
jgi:transposase